MPGSAPSRTAVTRWPGSTRNLLGDDEYDGLVGRHSQTNGLCLASNGKAYDVAAIRMLLTMMPDDEPKADEPKDGDKDGDKKDEEKEDEDKETKDESLLDGIPEEFIGPMLADLVAHEVGHTLGLRHNFKASSAYTMAEINSNELKGKKPFTGSVMDYNPVNINMETGEVQGDWTMIDIGPYDLWAIEYGYTFDEKALDKILARVSEPELAYATDEDTSGPDPLARRYDFSKDPLDYAKNADAAGPLPPRAAAREVRRGRRQLGQGPLRVRDDPGLPDQGHQHDGRTGSAARSSTATRRGTRATAPRSRSSPASSSARRSSSSSTTPSATTPSA